MEEQTITEEIKEQLLKVLEDNSTYIQSDRYIHQGSFDRVIEMTLALILWRGNHQGLPNKIK